MGYHAESGTSAVAQPVDDWSSGPWEQGCHTRLVRQRECYDCGVACMAMATGREYASARAVFECIGLDRKAHPFGSNFQELIKALRRQGHQAHMRRWQGWEKLEGIGILKIRTKAMLAAEHSGRNRRQWHWVVAERHSVFGYVLRDPALPLAAFGSPPLDTAHHGEQAHYVHGNWIQVIPAS